MIINEIKSKINLGLFKTGGYVDLDLFKTKGETYVCKALISTPKLNVLKIDKTMYKLF